MASMAPPRPAYEPGSGLNMILAFVERQTNIWKRFWAWELVWLVYGVVNTLAVTFIANEAGRQQFLAADQEQQLVLFLLLGTLAWAYLSAVLDDVSLTISWERWEGTIEHTLMAPAPRSIHLLGMCLFGVLHAIVRTLIIGGVALLFFSVDFGRADWVAAALVLLIGSVSIAGLAILTGILPMIYPERGSQMSFMMQAVILLVSGVYYSIDVLPGWMQAFAAISPATYILDGVRDAIQQGDGVTAVGRELVMLTLFGAALLPLSIVAFSAAERWAKKTGRLKRMG